ncbi:MAG TPA: response regulator transcription factor [Verrucomicrobiae bacterium]|jgi:two-component system KDP operon response regulator KdpE|nr:response regulator transcription factor [Verrucomicrobiae bacterium]
MLRPKKDGVRILIVDDERPLRRVLKRMLQSQGYRTFEAANGRAALKAAVKAHPDAIILDLKLPDISGVEVAREIRQRAATPIMILSVRGDEADKVAALDAGADDYVTKPFSPSEFLARVRALMRRWLPKGGTPIFKTGELVFDGEQRIVKVGDRTQHLTPTEYDVLKALVLSAGKIVRTEQLYKQVWNNDQSVHRMDHLLRVVIYNLRKKLEPDPARPIYILTEPAVGYRLRIDPPSISVPA